MRGVTARADGLGVERSACAGRRRRTPAARPPAATASAGEGGRDRGGDDLVARARRPSARRASWIASVPLRDRHRVPGAERRRQLALEGLALGARG